MKGERERINIGERRPGYRGDFIIDDVTQNIVKLDKTSAHKRRLLVRLSSFWFPNFKTDIPLFLFFSGMIFCIIYYWRILNQEIIKQADEEKISLLRKNAYM